jgi:uncharacterized membrane protein
MALREAFNSFDKLNYTYQPNEEIVFKGNKTTTETVENNDAKEEIQRLQREVEELKAKRVTEEIVLKESKKNKTLQDIQPEVKQEVKKVLKTESKSDETLQTLFANPIENGYTITDASSKVLYHLVFSGKEDVFIVKGQDAILYKMNNTWIVARANDAGVSMKTLNVKFN